MLLSTLLTVTTAALAAAAPAKKNKNEFTIRPVSRTDLCLDVQPAEGETAPYALIKPCRKENGRYVDSQTFYWETLPVDIEPGEFPSELLHSKYKINGVDSCLSTHSAEDSVYPGVVPVVDTCPAKDSAEYDYFRWSYNGGSSLQIYRRRGLRAVLKQMDLAREDNNQTTFVAALKSPNGKPDTQWQFIKV